FYGYMPPFNGTNLCTQLGIVNCNTPLLGGIALIGGFKKQHQYTRAFCAFLCHPNRLGLFELPPPAKATQTPPVPRYTPPSPAKVISSSAATAPAAAALAPATQVPDTKFLTSSPASWMATNTELRSAPSARAAGKMASLPRTTTE